MLSIYKQTVSLCTLNLNVIIALSLKKWFKYHCESCLLSNIHTSMPGELVQVYNKLNMHRAGLEKRFLSIDDVDGTTVFCYTEKGTKVPEQPSIVFIHGFSSDKNTWAKIIKDIPDGFHCIAIDMPGHGESVGFNEEHFIAVNLIDKLKVFFDKLNLIEPMCLVGSSMGGSIVAMFATKYRSYVSMICLLAPVPPGEEYETKMLRELRLGMYQIVLPETPKQLYAAADALSMKKIHLGRLLAKEYLKFKSPLLDQHKIVLKSAFKYTYPNLGQYYEKLKNLPCPALIIWGRQDQLCALEGADYFADLIPDAELIIFDNCGHLIPADKPKETANNIIHFWKIHHSFLTRL